MTLFLVVGIVGVVLLLVALVADDVLGSAVDSIDFTGGYLSTTAIAAFLAAFGFGGALVVSGGGSQTTGAVVGLAAGLVVGGIAAVVTRSMLNSRTDETITPEHVVGSAGTVITAIAEGGFGEVSVLVAGQPLKLNARADEPLAMGTAVTVTASLSSTSVKVTRRPE